MARNDRPDDEAGSDEQPVTAGSDETETQTHVDLTKIETGHPTERAELTVRVWLIGSLIARTTPAVMSGLIGFLAASGIMVAAIMMKTDLLWAGVVAGVIVLATMWLVYRIAPAQPVRKKTRRIAKKP